MGKQDKNNGAQGLSRAELKAIVKHVDACANTDRDTAAQPVPMPRKGR